MAALAVAPTRRTVIAEEAHEAQRHVRGPRAQQRSPPRSETPGEPAFSPDVPTVQRPRGNEDDLAGAAPVPVAEVLQLVSSLRDLPLKVQSAVLLRVFGRVTDPNPDLGQ